MADTDLTLTLSDDDAHDLLTTADPACTEFFVHNDGDSAGAVKVHVDGIHVADQWAVLQPGVLLPFKNVRIQHVQVKRAAAGVSATIYYGPVSKT